MPAGSFVLLLRAAGMFPTSIDKADELVHKEIEYLVALKMDLAPLNLLLNAGTKVAIEQAVLFTFLTRNQPLQNLDGTESSTHPLLKVSDTRLLPRDCVWFSVFQYLLHSELSFATGSRRGRQRSRSHSGWRLGLKFRRLCYE